MLHTRSWFVSQAKPDATVEVKISEDMQDVAFDFYNSPFQIHDDSYVLKQMALHERATAAQGAAPTQRPPSVSNTERECDGGCD